MRIPGFIGLIWLLAVGTVLAQGNPFELRHRLSPEERQRIIFNERNPFELIRGDEAEAILRFLPSAAGPGQALRPQADLRYMDAPGLLFWAYMALFVMATLLINIGRSRMGRWFRAMFNDQLSISLLRERQRGNALNYQLWYLFFFANGGIFLFQGLNWWNGGLFPGEDFRWLLWLAGGLAGFYLFKHAIHWLTAGIFPLHRPLQQYGFTITLFNALLGLALFPVNIGMSYAVGPLREVFLYTGCLLLAASLILRLIRGLWIGLPYLTRSPIHFFLYLCAVEVAPVLILAQWILRSGSALNGL
jgi:hypothetical protein